jgi:hypothetical protein
VRISGAGAIGNLGIVSALQPVRRPAMTKDTFVIYAGMLTVGVGILTFWGNPQSAKPARTEVVRILADDPTLKLATETSPYMRT